MRNNDPTVMTQMILGHFSGAKLQSTQHTGVYLAYISDNWINNSTIPVGTLRFQVNKIDPNAGWVEAPYAGRGVPPVGTECVVAFEGVLGNMPRIVSFNGWQSSPLIFVQSATPTEADLVPGDLWIEK